MDPLIICTLVHLKFYINSIIQKDNLTNYLYFSFGVMISQLPNIVIGKTSSNILNWNGIQLYDYTIIYYPFSGWWAF